MDYLLLDIDGVLVTGKSWISHRKMEDGFAEFIPEAVNNLNKILDITFATIVLTTSHKNTFTLNTWREIFLSRGVMVNNIERVEYPTNQNLSRFDEIMLWYERKGLNKNFVIIDDDKSLYNLPYELKVRCIITSPYEGLNSQNAEDAIDLLTFANSDITYKENKISSSKITAAKTIYKSFEFLSNYPLVPRYAVIDNIKASVKFNEWEKGRTASGKLRWESIFDYVSIACVKAGLLIKTNGYWQITPKGKKLLDYGPNVVLSKIENGYKQWKISNRI